jgi:hypothetical protein
MVGNCNVMSVIKPNQQKFLTSQEGESHWGDGRWCIFGLSPRWEMGDWEKLRYGRWEIGKIERWEMGYSLKTGLGDGRSMEK